MVHAASATSERLLEIQNLELHTRTIESQSGLSRDVVICVHNLAQEAWTTPLRGIR